MQNHLTLHKDKQSDFDIKHRKNKITEENTEKIKSQKKNKFLHFPNIYCQRAKLCFRNIWQIVICSSIFFVLANVS